MKLSVSQHAIDRFIERYEPAAMGECKPVSLIKRMAHESVTVGSEECARLGIRPQEAGSVCRVHRRTGLIFVVKNERLVTTVLVSGRRGLTEKATKEK